MTDDPLDEILTLVVQTDGNADPEFIRQIHYHIKDFFSGVYPGFQASSTKCRQITEKEIGPKEHIRKIITQVFQLFAYHLGIGNFAQY